MQINVLGTERRRRQSCEEKVGLVEETFQGRRDGLQSRAPARGAHSLLFTKHALRSTNEDFSVCG